MNSVEIPRNWTFSGAPTPAKLEAIVRQGARVISHSPPSALMYDEEALVLGLGGSFARPSVDEEDLRDPQRRAEIFAPYREALAAGGQVYVHCNTGNRAGAVWALFVWEVLGASPREALAAGRAAGLGVWEPTVEAVMSGGAR